MIVEITPDQTKEVTVSQLASLLKSSRDNVSLKQDGVGRDVGCSGAYIAQIEAGRTVPALDMAVKLEALYGLQQGTLTLIILKIKLQVRVLELLKEAKERGIEASVQMSLQTKYLPSNRRLTS